MGPISSRNRHEDHTGGGLRRAVVHAVLRRRRMLQLPVDACAWALVVPSATALRYDFRLEHLRPGQLAVYVALVVALQAAVGATEGLYAGRYAFGAFEEAAGLARTVIVVTVAGAVLNMLVPAAGLPRSVPWIAGLAALALMCGARYAWRLALERRRRPTRAAQALVFGAGEGGRQLITSMLRSADSPYLPVAILDDDAANRHLRLRGVPVVGNRHDMASAAREHKANVLIIAIPSATAQLVRDLSAAAEAAGLEVRILPRVGELLDDPTVGDVRALTESDLLGRHEIDTNLDSIAEYLTGKRVLVTGAGGSIGSELSRQIFRFAPATLVMLDRDESALHAVELSIKGRALLDADDLVVADIRDAERMDEVFSHHRPDVVFHAAALKHLTLLEQHPTEGVKTNVLGTLNVLRAAMDHGVRRFVNISTDKAADPTSMLGYTKRIAERLTAWAAGRTDGTYLSVRFGNVLGSRGSVLTAFRTQIDKGGPVTVTHPDVTRYFMTVEEAVQLVIQAGALGDDGEALVLDMGEPVRIAEVARRLIAESGRRIDIVHTGLRPGEKLHEVLRAEGEVDHRPHHPLISHVAVPFLDPAHVTASPPAVLAADARRICHLHRGGAPSTVGRA